MKNLFKPLFFKSLSGVFLLLIFSNCRSEAEPKYEDYGPEDFLIVPGIVTKITRTSIIGGRLYEYNVYYAYNLESDTVLVGKEMDVDMVLSEGDGVYILVHKKEENVSFLAGLRIAPHEEEIIESYLKKSKENGVKYFGIDEQ